MEAAMQHGVRGSYLSSDMQNYPPVFIAILEGYGHVLDFLGIEIRTAHLSSKMLPILFDLGTMAALLLLFRRWTCKRRLTLLACLAFNPALLADGAVWGQIDVFHSALMAISVLLVLTQPLAAGILIAVALLSKFQAIVVLPVLGALLLRQLLRRDWRRPLLFIAGFAIPSALTAGWFAMKGALDDMVRMAYLSATDMYPQLSLNAFNLWYHLFTNPSVHDDTIFFGGVSYKTFGFILLGVVCLFVAAYILLLRDLKTVHLLKAAALVNLAFFLLPTEIHERYGVPAMLFLLLIPFLLEPGRERIRWGVPAGLFTMSTALNIWLVLNGGFGGKWLRGGAEISLGMSFRRNQLAGLGPEQGKQLTGNQSWHGASISNGILSGWEHDFAVVLVYANFLTLTLVIFLMSRNLSSRKTEGNDLNKQRFWYNIHY
ncbi:hypothetical protein [Paenibacillus sp. P22]|uniref:hypothetical protein n=1 Tax=Paenibacillus sp. P22 TaxID=483908 RepID=UPI0012EE0D8D|nr:hypothetical protein [Paenibacillus sp. P22]